MESKRKYDIKNYEFDKPSGTVHSRIFKQDKNKKKYYSLSPSQFDIFNLMMYEVNRNLMNEFKSVKNIINLVKNDYEQFERIIDTQWYEITWNEINKFNKTNTSNRTILIGLLQDLQNVSMETNIIDKNKDLGKVTFSLVRKFSNYKHKIKYKLEPELFHMIMFQQPLTSETFVPLKLKVQSHNLKTVAAKKLYEFLKDWLTMRSDYIISFTNLLHLLNIDDTITTNAIYGSFNRDHLKKAVKEINEKSDIKVTYEPIKEKLEGQRKQVTKIKFFMETQNEQRLKELGLLNQEEELSIEDQILMNKAEQIYNNLPKFRKDKIENKEQYIKSIFKKDYDKLKNELMIDNWINNILNNIPISSDQPQTISILVDDNAYAITDTYLIKDLDSNEYLTKNSNETIEFINEIVNNQEHSIEMLELGNNHEFSNSSVNF